MVRISTRNLGIPTVKRKNVHSGPGKNHVGYDVLEATTIRTSKVSQRVGGGSIERQTECQVAFSESREDETSLKTRITPPWILNTPLTGGGIVCRSFVPPSQLSEELKWLKTYSFLGTTVAKVKLSRNSRRVAFPPARTCAF